MIETSCKPSISELCQTENPLKVLMLEPGSPRAHHPKLKQIILFATGHPAVLPEIFLEQLTFPLRVQLMFFVSKQGGALLVLQCP
jgi:hypothetical protein